MLIGLIDICSDSNTVGIFKFWGYILKVAFIAVPILLIVMGSIDILKAVAANKEEDIKKAYSTLIKRIIAAVIVFLVPIIVNLFMNAVLGVDKSNCYTCLINPDSC